MRRKPLDRLGHPTTFLQRQITNTTNKMIEVRNRLKRYAVTNDAEDIWNHVDDQQCLALMVKLWTESYGRATAILGSDKVRQIIKGELPSYSEIQLMIDKLRNEHERLGRTSKLRREGIRRAHKKWDWEKNHGRLAFRSSKTEYVPPLIPFETPSPVINTSRMRHRYTKSSSATGKTCSPCIRTGANSGVIISVQIMGNIFRTSPMLTNPTDARITLTSLGA